MFRNFHKIFTDRKRKKFADENIYLLKTLFLNISPLKVLFIILSRHIIFQVFF